MAFKTILPPSGVADGPEKLIRDLPRRKIPDALPHQREVMSNYATHAVNASDVALQLPTGSGKTLVGLMIGEWLRQKNHERVVYLCPTKQLVNQVVEQADEKYGLTVVGFTGSARDYDPRDKAAYRDADSIAITTHSSLFNTNPYFNDADVIIVDDAHAAESYVAALWSVRVERTKLEHAALHAALRGVLEPLLDPTDFTRLSGTVDNLSDWGWVDKIPSPDLAAICDEITAVFDVHTKGTDLRYSWSMLRGHLRACHLYVSSTEILIRPLIPPTWSHASFVGARQRIYMSATLGAGGDLERLMGRKSIQRLPIPQGWDRQGVGRRFFIFPSMSLKDEGATELRRELMRRAGRSLVLVPSDRAALQVVQDVTENLGYPTFSADDIEASKKPFVAEQNAVAVIANRYDGIDFPGKECRLLFIEGHPKATNLQERFLMARMGSIVLFNERIQTRVLQAVGRCTRGLEDFSAVVVSGDELPDYLADIKRRRFFHPELQAEIAFGIEQSKDSSLTDIIENFETFLDNGKAWEEVNQQIVTERKRATQQPFPAMDELNNVVSHEVEYQERMWQGDFEAAIEAAETVLGGLTVPELRGYRATWHYLAGVAAWYGGEDGVTGLAAKSRSQFSRAKEAANRIPWLVALARYQSTDSAAAKDNAISLGQIERVEVILEQLGTVHDRSFSQREKEILEGLASKDKGPFEQAHKKLGELLGFTAGKRESDGSPDPWWIAGKICFVFEDHAGAEAGSTLDVTKARQVSSHPAWMRANVPLAQDADVVPVLVTPVTTVKLGAIPHLAGVALWPLDEFREWAAGALRCLRELRRTFAEPGDLIWRAAALEHFEERGIDAPGLVSTLRARPAEKHLKGVK